MKATTMREAEAMVTANPCDRHGFGNAATLTVARGVRKTSGVQPGMSGAEYRAALNDNQAAAKEAVAAAPLRGEETRRLLRDAGYVFSRERSRWERNGFFAVAHGYDWAETSVHVFVAAIASGAAATPCHPAESLAYAR